jgi:hypothetical protein
MKELSNADLLAVMVGSASSNALETTLKQALALVFVVTGNNATSFAERGLL